jgi:hypothetical protein
MHFVPKHPTILWWCFCPSFIHNILLKFQPKVALFHYILGLEEFQLHFKISSLILLCLFESNSNYSIFH